MSSNAYDVLIIGGGFYGLYIAKHLAERGRKVIVLEKEQAFMTRASYNNQARVHNGYHYPRSVLTALRSRVLFPQFVNEFRDCIDDSFQQYYLIGKVLGKVSAAQFEMFCKRIGADCDVDTSFFDTYCDRRYVEQAFRVNESAFNTTLIREKLLQNLHEVRAETKLGVDVLSVREAHGCLEISTSEQGEPYRASQVYNCTYSGLNGFSESRNAGIIPLKHEFTEMCLVEVPEPFRNCGVTVMCGPFFSVMPFPATGNHSFSHVRYTPHYGWTEEERINTETDSLSRLKALAKSNWNKMRRDAQRLVPLLGDCKYVDSLYEIKTILPSSEMSDSRPILFRQNHGLQGFHTVMGGKIDNIYDVIEIIKAGELE